MKGLKQLRSFLVLGLTLLFVAPSHNAEAQLQKLPLDSAIRTGKLENGLTYFIRHNEKPEGRAEFYIAQKVGSILEKDSQSGLAHFLEHMAFNGTKNFPDKGIINWLETIGVSFGSNINAYTAFDETVYTLMNVPVNRQSIIDSCVLILHDWSSAITLADKEIDAERGVIQEEWRQRNTGNLRVMFKHIQQIMPTSKYGKRFPIGSMDVVRNFKYKELRDYYKKWYRPDLQAVIVVGDVDVDKVEATIKRIFADIPKPVNPAKREYEQVEELNKTIVSIATDKEVGSIDMSVSFRLRGLPEQIKGTAVDVFMTYAFAQISQMIGERFSDIMHKPNPPFLSAYYYKSDWGLVARDLKALTFNASVKAGKEKEGFDALVKEIERLRRYGFTASELARAKKNYLASMKKYYTERNNRKNGSLANQCVSYFNKGEYLLSPEEEYKIAKDLDANIKIDAINQMIKKLLEVKEVAITYTGPEKEGVKTPTEAELLAMYEAAQKQTVEAPVEEKSDVKLMEKAPKAGKIVKEEKGQYDSTIWTLENGAKIIIKPTKLKEDEIIISASRPGGTLALRSKEARVNVQALPFVLNIGGLANFDSTQLEKILTGRIAGAHLGLSETTESLSANCINDDMEQMMQLIYLNFTAPRKDDTAFKALQERYINGIKASKANPMSSLGDTINAIAFPNDPYKKSFTEDDVKAIDYARVMELRRELFNGVDGFNFVVVGNVDLKTFRPMVETYIASLPKGTTRMNVPYGDIKGIQAGKFVKHYEKEISTPSGTVIDLFTGKVENTLRNRILARVLSEILDQAYTASIREKEGGTYGVGTSAGIERFPNGLMNLQIFFQTEPSKAEYLNGLVKKELKDIIEKGANKDYFTKAVKSIIKRYKESEKENYFWSGKLAHYYNPVSQGEDLVNGYLDLVNSLKVEEVQALLKQLMAQENSIEVILRPLAKKEEAKAEATCDEGEKAVGCKEPKAEEGCEETAKAECKEAEKKCDCGSEECDECAPEVEYVCCEPTEEEAPMKVVADDKQEIRIAGEDEKAEACHSKADELKEHKAEETCHAKVEEKKVVLATKLVPAKKVKPVLKVARFKGGVKSMMSYLDRIITYPRPAYENGISGKVVVKFIVTKEGKIRNAKFLKKADNILNKEVLRVIYTMPVWTPATKDGVAIDSYYTIPVKFVIPTKKK